MTRFLSESLLAHEPNFRLGLRQLEAAHGNPSADIRLTTAVQHATRTKLQHLGLDPADTTGKELYHSLMERIRSDDARLVKTLRTRAATHISAEADLVAGMAHALQENPASQVCLAMKTSAFKALIKKAPPKKAMKQLGYRSLDSFMKHEPAALILAAARLTESAAWLQTFSDQYKRLKVTDFESRPLVVLNPSTKRWKTLAAASVATSHHNVLSFPELGTIVLLPLPHDVPAGAATASLAIALHALNDLRAATTYLKMASIRSDFGAAVQVIAKGEPQLAARLLDKTVPWHIIQRYYARLQHRFSSDLFEPHLRLEDMTWPAVENLLSHIEPTLSFWHQSSALGVLSDHKPVSLNVVDAALNLCNQLPFERRIVHYFQQSLWHELTLQYLKHDTVEQSVLTQLQPQFAYAQP